MADYSDKLKSLQAKLADCNQSLSDLRKKIEASEFNFYTTYIEEQKVLKKDKKRDSESKKLLISFLIVIFLLILLSLLCQFKKKRPKS